MTKIDKKVTEVVTEVVTPEVIVTPEVVTLPAITNLSLRILGRKAGEAGTDYETALEAVKAAHTIVDGCVYYFSVSYREGREYVESRENAASAQKAANEYSAVEAAVRIEKARTAAPTDHSYAVSHHMREAMGEGMSLTASLTASGLKNIGVAGLYYSDGWEAGIISDVWDGKKGMDKAETAYVSLSSEGVWHASTKYAFTAAKSARGEDIQSAKDAAILARGGELKGKRAAIHMARTAALKAVNSVSQAVAAD